MDLYQRNVKMYIKIGRQFVLVWDFINKVVAKFFERKQICRSPRVNVTTGVKLSLESVCLDGSFCAGII